VIEGNHGDLSRARGVEKEAEVSADNVSLKSSSINIDYMSDECKQISNFLTNKYRTLLVGSGTNLDQFKEQNITA